MGVLVISAVFSLSTVAAGAMDAPNFELMLDDRNGEKTFAVRNAATGAFAIAEGGDDLQLLSGEEAKSAFAVIDAQNDIDINLDGDKAARNAKGKRKIVIHKMDYEEDENDIRADKEVRIVTRRENGKDDDREIIIETGDDSDRDMVILNGDADDGEKRRVIRIMGADPGEAAKFIDDENGLDADEKAAMKAAVGL